MMASSRASLRLKLKTPKTARNPSEVVSVIGPSMTASSTAPLLKNAAAMAGEVGVGVVLDHLELDAGVLERADRGPPAQVGAGGHVGLALFQVERQVLDVADFDPHRSRRDCRCCDRAWPQAQLHGRVPPLYRDVSERTGPVPRSPPASPPSWRALPVSGVSRLRSSASDLHRPAGTCRSCSIPASSSSSGLPVSTRLARMYLRPKITPPITSGTLAPASDQQQHPSTCCGPAVAAAVRVG